MNLLSPKSDEYAWCSICGTAFRLPETEDTPGFEGDASPPGRAGPACPRDGCDEGPVFPWTLLRQLKDTYPDEPDLAKRYMTPISVRSLLRMRDG